MKRRVVSLVLVVAYLLIPFQVAFALQGYTDYANKARNYYEQKDYNNAAKYYEKAYEISKQEVFKNNAMVSYSNYVTQLVNKDEYSRAIEINSKLISKFPNEKKLKEQLSDIYYFRSTEYFYKGDLYSAKSDLEKSKQFATVEDQKQRASENLEKINLAISKNLVPYTSSKNTTTMSIAETLTILEDKALGKQNKNKSLVERVKVLEEKSLKQTYDKESLTERVDRLKEKIAPDYFASSVQQDAFITTNNNYINSIIDQSNGQVQIFGTMPILVYVDTYSTKLYKKEYRKILEDAIKEWTKASGDLIKFEFTNNPHQAKIKIVFKDQHEEYPWKPVLKTIDVNEKQQKKKYRKASTLVRIGSMAAMIAGGLIGIPVIGTVGAVGSQVASPYLAYKGHEDNKFKSDVIIGLNDLKDMSEDKASTLIKRRVIHQVGHAIGIQGHSANPNDIMHIDYQSENISERDRNTIREIYKGLYVK